MIKKIITADTSETYLNEQVGECYHSLKGAAEEAMQKYAIPCKIKELAKTGSMRILDVCFGLGYNSAMAISVALEENPHCKIEVIGLEYDAEIISLIQEVNPPIAFYQFYKSLTPQQLEFAQGNVIVKILFGLAKISLSSLMSACTALNSSSIFLRSRPASFWSFMSRIASA